MEILFMLAAPQARDCAIDRDALLALDQPAFDHDLEGGWRILAARGCHTQAADLIRDWRQIHRAQDAILTWHEGQMRAFAGDYAAAITLFKRSRKPADRDDFGWNLYVDGSIAFLSGDRTKLRGARAELAAMAKPDIWARLQDTDGRPTSTPWPPNLHVLDAFMRCWGMPYREAYSCPKPAMADGAKP
ncbi:hypothetical protein [Novosphingobium sp. BW1]|uniref:hypothetical protein n=1 Tax=Novosphingobium sp. BW1 TaxID=2592621 RepID=UPI001F076183|nr:hypothetical protein [Novosphingobium sp. BW1]